MHKNKTSLAQNTRNNKPNKTKKNQLQTDGIEELNSIPNNKHVTN